MPIQLVRNTLIFLKIYLIYSGTLQGILWNGEGMISGIPWWRWYWSMAFAISCGFIPIAGFAGFSEHPVYKDKIYSLQKPNLHV